MEIDYILCHGSGNRFLLLDTVRQADALAGANLERFARTVCGREAFSTDGLLLLVGDGLGYGMRMFNTDGSEAGMCGNGIRCVARLAQEYLRTPCLELRSGGRSYSITREKPIHEGLPTYGVRIPVRLSSSDYPASMSGAFVGKEIAALDPTLRFTYLDTGNPHVVACTGRIDLVSLERLGREAAGQTELFPHGMNVSFFTHEGAQRIFVATYERGVGLTSSCGTAMTASSTAACLLGVCAWDQTIEVCNRGGMVRCLCHRVGAEIQTTLTGNATFEERGRLRYDAVTQRVEVLAREEYAGEREAYARFVEDVTAKYRAR